MSSDNCLILNLKNFKVTYYQGEGIANAWKCKNLEEAIKKIQEIEEEYGGTEYGVHFVDSLKKK